MSGQQNTVQYIYHVLLVKYIIRVWCVYVTRNTW
jgi:hypothetical protein